MALSDRGARRRRRTATRASKKGRIDTDHHAYQTEMAAHDQPGSRVGDAPRRGRSARLAGMRESRRTNVTTDRRRTEDARRRDRARRRDGARAPGGAIPAMVRPAACGGSPIRVPTAPSTGSATTWVFVCHASIGPCPDRQGVPMAGWSGRPSARPCAGTDRDGVSPEAAIPIRGSCIRGCAGSAWTARLSRRHRSSPTWRRSCSPCSGFRPTGVRSPVAGVAGWLRSIREVEWAFENLEGVIDTKRARQVWRAALDAEPPAGSEVWIHGDLLPGNILVAEGRLAGVIDWSATGVGDPACDAMFAWAWAQKTEPCTGACSDSTTRRGPVPAAGWWSRPPCTSRTTRRRCPMAVAQAKKRMEAALSDEP